MSTNPPLITKRTLKQAKADFKARGRPTLSALEQKQLERSIQLDRRAWGVKEREKRKADAARKRAVENEKREQGEREKKALAVGEGRRRCDRFGYLGSQLCLGAFFGGGGEVGKRGEVRDEGTVKVEGDDRLRVDEEEAFGDDGVDDETLLDALASPKCIKSERPQHPQSDSAVPVPVSPRATVLRRSATEPPFTMADELGDFWDELGSSTQIARELASEDPKPGPNATGSKSAIQTARSIPHVIIFHPPPRAGNTRPKSALKSDWDRKLMPPPMMKPPPRPLRNSRHPPVPRPPLGIIKVSQPLARTASSVPQPAAKFSFFTKTELEDFVDDDLQLTQVAPG
ncbi:hypothetical protein B0A55_05590 [Friedmanniomyces simplex]|uniref:Uncharacterized protein n=1 Tax=Friedmanniomyces simplex TaxID=329884 RepID=A0A4U0XE47_9PEZI|nr:hypothetical protein B0A55_05590 [Friedmanniomyces simplex]